jgi:hypothetical protein
MASSTLPGQRGESCRTGILGPRRIWLVDLLISDEIGRPQAPPDQHSEITTRVEWTDRLRKQNSRDESFLNVMLESARYSA